MAYEGTVVAGRFEIERLAGRGGMGAVYRARDRETGGVAALKVLHDEAPAAHHERLAREARLLAELTHPAFVRYLGFGLTEGGKPYLAMEWLDGEDLAARLKRVGLAPAEAVRVATRVAAALGAAHARGIVHRDIKPSNLFLVDSDPDRIKVLDFGIARAEHDAAMTLTGAAIGTPRYMAPEQARGSRDLDARADIFSLGCVLFECLAGRPAFTGNNPAAILAKIVLEDAPHLSLVRAGLPPALEDLVARMMAKQPGSRPRDGTAVAAELEAIVDLGDEQGEAISSQGSAVTTGEQRLLCVVFAAAAIIERDETVDSDVPDMRPGQREPTASMTGVAELAESTMTSMRGGSNVLRALAATVATHRGHTNLLADGSVVITLLGDGAATDQAARAARCALAIRALLPRAPMALAIGRGVVGDRIPLGELIDRATGLVSGSDSTGIRVDEVSAGLLDVRFSIGCDEHGMVLAGERDVAAVARTLLGKPIPCIGRERELATLGAIFDECVAEPMAHVVVVTGAAGVGKSRLRYELVQRIAADAEIWIGRGDPMSAGAPFAMLAQALRRAAGIVDDEPVSIRHWKLKTRVSRYVPLGDIPRVTEFLGELLGASLAVPGSVQLHAARQDPKLMGDQMLRACEDFVAAECAARPVLIVLEDLQWSDVPTVQFIDSIVRRLADRPLLVLALARPDVDAVFPRLWSERGVERIRLGELTRRAAEKLVRTALGDDVAAETVNRLVERAAGNAFYLEELIRSVAEGYGDRLPETIVAMAQARIESLELEARQVLRAASIFGQVFWPGGVAALLEGGTTEADEWIHELVRRELVTARRDSRFVGEAEYVFRHALVREAAYAMLTDRDRTVGHRLAGEWLELRASAPHADVETVALAEHFLRGGELRRSIAWFQRAAELALEGDDLGNAIERAERAIACVHAVGNTDEGADRLLVGALRQLQSGAHSWRGEYALAVERGDEALERLSPASPRWLAAAANVAEACARRLEHARVLELCRELATIELTADTYHAYAYAVGVTMTTLLWHGDSDLTERLFARLDRLETEAGEDPAVGAWIHVARAWRALREGDHAASMLLDARAEEFFTMVGDQRHACMQRANVGYGELMVGAYARAEQSLTEAIAIATRIGLHQVTTQAQHNLGLALARQGKVDVARQVETFALDAFVAQDNRRLAAGARNYLAMIEIAAGHFTVAIDHANQAIGAAGDKAGTMSTYHGTLSHAYRLAGDTAAALAAAREGMHLIELHGRPEEGEAALRLAFAEALHAAGAIDEARGAIAEAAGMLHEVAARIRDPKWRASYLEAIPENAAILALAQAWG